MTIPCSVQQPYASRGWLCLVEVFRCGLCHSCRAQLVRSLFPLAGV